MRLRKSCSIGRLLLCGTLWLSIDLVAPRVRADALYSITDLGTLSGQTSSVATSINNSGQVAGISYNSSDGYFAQTVLWQRQPPRFTETGSGAQSFLYSNGQTSQIIRQAASPCPSTNRDKSSEARIPPSTMLVSMSEDQTPESRSRTRGRRPGSLLACDDVTAAPVPPVLDQQFRHDRRAAGCRRSRRKQLRPRGLQKRASHRLGLESGHRG